MSAQYKSSLVSTRARRIIFLIIFLIALGVVINQAVLPGFNRKLVYESGKLKIVELLSYTSAESRVLKILIDDTPILGRIPQLDDLKNKAHLNDDDLERDLGSLSAKGDIVMNSETRIIAAYPWTDSNSGIDIRLISDRDSFSAPFHVASALYGFSVARLIGSDIRIEARLEDTGEPLTIEIRGDAIAYTNRIEAVVYDSKDYRDSRFYSSPEGARNDNPEDFRINRAIRLDKALAIGDNIADEIRKKMREDE